MMFGGNATHINLISSVDTFVFRAISDDLPQDVPVTKQQDMLLYHEDLERAEEGFQEYCQRICPQEEETMSRRSEGGGASAASGERRRM